MSKTDPLGLVDLNHFSSSESIRTSATKVPLSDSVFKVGAHGNSSTVADASGKRLSSKELADQIRAHPKYKEGMTVNLLFCNTGKGDQPYAQKLANELNAPVNAPNEYLWYYSDGRTTPAGMLPNRQMDTASPGWVRKFNPSN